MATPRHPLAGTGGRPELNGSARPLARCPPVRQSDAVRSLAEPAALVPPTLVVRESFLAGEREHARDQGLPTDWLDWATTNFETFVAHERAVQIRWGVPSTRLWYVSGEHYIGTLVIRHELTPELTDVGGHVGYHVVPAWRRQGHATRMLAAGLAECRRLGLRRVLLSCRIDNEASRRVILANGGIPDGRRAGEDRFWITL